MKKNILFEKIKRYREERQRKKSAQNNLKVVKRSNKIGQALSLPKVLNLNPRSLYNKVEEFVTFVTEENIDLTCISESWERENLKLNEIISIDDYEVISNVFQRKGIGGRPAIVVNKKKFQVENLTQSVIEIPWGVEAVWALLTPKNSTSASKIQKIAVGSIYCKPNSKKKTALLDHIAQVYHKLCSKYSNGLYWIICGDTNSLKLDSILHLSKHMKQVVQNPTRLDPPQILDPIITTLSSYYQVPKCLPPLGPDSEINGKASDHLMVVMEPINVINNLSAREKQEITYRAISDEKLENIKKWAEEKDWEKVMSEKCAHKKAEYFQSLFYTKFCEIFP